MGYINCLYSNLKLLCLMLAAWLRKGGKTLAKVDYREKNMCIFCKAWLGEPADTNFATGKSKFPNAKGMCRSDGELHSPNGLCKDFEKNILYL